MEATFLYKYMWDLFQPYFTYPSVLPVEIFIDTLWRSLFKMECFSVNCICPMQLSERFDIQTIVSIEYSV